MRKHFIAFYHCTKDKIAYVSVCPSNAKTLLHPENFNQLSFIPCVKFCFALQYLLVRLNSQSEAVQHFSSAMNIFCSPKMFNFQTELRIQVGNEGIRIRPPKKKNGPESSRIRWQSSNFSSQYLLIFFKLLPPKPAPDPLLYLCFQFSRYNLKTKVW